MTGTVWRATRPLRWAGGLGALSGLVAAGVGSRVVMKLVARAAGLEGGRLGVLTLVTVGNLLLDSGNAASVPAIVCAVGAVAFVGGTIGKVEDEGTCLRAVGGGEGCAVFADR